MAWSLFGNKKPAQPAAAVSAPASAPAAGGESFKQRWEAMPAGRKKNIMALGTLGVILAGSWIVVSGDTSGPRDAATRGRVQNALMPSDGGRDLGVTSVSNDVRDMRQQIRNLQGDLARQRQIIERQQATAAGGASPEARMQAEIAQLRQQVDRLAAAGAQGQGRPAPAGTRTVGTPGTAQGSPSVRPGPPGTVQPELAPPPPPAYGGVRTIRQEQAASPRAAAPRPAPEVPQFYLPSGSMIEAVLLTGVDAPTGRAAQRDPIPVLARVQASAILPNRYRADVRECFILLEAAGDLPSERAMMRTNQMSCVRRDGSILDVAIAGYGVGEDGRAGLRGRVLSKQGQMLARAAMAGFADGVSSAFGGQNANNFRPGSEGIDYSNVPEAGVVGGASSALDRIAAYYIELAEQLHPVVEIDSGRRVTIVMTRGRNMAVIGAGSGDVAVRN